MLRLTAIRNPHASLTQHSTLKFPLCIDLRNNVYKPALGVTPFDGISLGGMNINFVINFPLANICSTSRNPVKMCMEQTISFYSRVEPQIRRDHLSNTKCMRSCAGV